LRRSSEGSAGIGIVTGTALAYTARLTPIYPLTIGGFSMPGYTAFYTRLLNLVVAVIFAPLLKS
jgi:solute:Na+ symporter, SSS family